MPDRRDGINTPRIYRSLFNRSMRESLRAMELSTITRPVVSTGLRTVASRALAGTTRVGLGHR